MKKYFLLSGIIFATTLLFSCSKEQEIVNDGENQEGTALNTIEAYIVEGTDSKTAYDSEGKFTWSNPDKITMVVYNSGSPTPSKKGTIDKYTYDTSNVDGRYATFSGSAFDDEWKEAGIALYPNYKASSYNCLTQGGTYDVDNKIEHFTVSLNQEIRPNLATPLDLVPLIGRKDGSGYYQFSTATGILKVTIKNIPSAARYVVLRSNNDYVMCGTFSLDSGSSEIKESNYLSGGYYQKSIKFTPDADGEDRDFYFPLPTGTIPAGMTLLMDTGSSERILTKTTTSAITITANHITPLKAVTAEHFKTIGTAQFYDKGPSNGWGSLYHAEVELQQSLDDSNTYRLVNPYGTYWSDNGISAEYTPSDYLTFTVDLSTDKVTAFDNHNIGRPTGVGSGNVFIRYKSSDHNKVWQKSGGSPLIVQLAPEYRYADDSDGTDCSGDDHRIEIIFPNYDTSTTLNGTSLASASTAEFAVTGTNVAKFRVNVHSSGNAEAANAVDERPLISAGNSATFGGYTGNGHYTRYIAYKAFNSDGTEIALKTTGAVYIYSITSDISNKYAHQYIINYTQSSLSSESGTTSMTFAVSNDILKGNIMITEFDGICWDISESTHWDMESPNSTHYYATRTTPRLQANFTDGQPIYGEITESTATFNNVGSQHLYHDDNGGSWHTIAYNQSSTTYSDLDFTMTYESPVSKISFTKSFLGDYYAIANGSHQFWFKVQGCIGTYTATE